MKTLYISLLLLFSVVHIGYACSCAYVPTFCETISYGGTVDSFYLIVHARVENKSASEMKIRVIDVLFGTTPETVLTIPQGYGADCRESINRFNENSEYIFALYGTSDIGYNLYICGVTSLTVSGNQIIGDIAPGVHKLAIKDFPTLQNCGGIGSLLSSVDVTPTLASGTIHVSTTRDIEDMRITMYDLMGRLVYSAQPDILLAALPWDIDSRHFPAGYYAIITETAGIRRVFKVVIVF
jgi:hypothetical protein